MAVDIIALYYFIVSNNNITFSGQSTIAVYQQALASVLYFNGANEPSTQPSRRVQFQVFDGIFYSNSIVGLINITLVDDNRLVLDCGAGISSFSEGQQVPVLLASFLSLSDLDSNHVVSGASVMITNAQQGDSIQFDSSLVMGSISIAQLDEARIELSGIVMAMQYQVRGTT